MQQLPSSDLTGADLRDEVVDLDTQGFRLLGEFPRRAEHLSGRRSSLARRCGDTADVR